MWAPSPRRCLEGAILCAALAGATPGAAQTQTDGLMECSVRLVREVTGPTFVYDPFATAAAVERVRFELEAPAEGELLLTFETEAGVALPVPLGASGVQLGIGSESGGGWVPATPGSILTRTDADGRQALDVDFFLDNVVVAQPGSFTERIFVRIENRSNGVVCAQRPAFDILMNVPPRAQVNIAGLNGDFARSLRVGSIDFGSLETGESRRVFVQIRSNSDVMLSVSSQNNGAMVLGGDGATEGRVEYRALLDGAEIPLATEYKVPLPAAADFRGRSLPLDVIIGPVEAAPSGAYSDYVRIEISAF